MYDSTRSLSRHGLSITFKQLKCNKCLADFLFWFFPHMTLDQTCIRQGQAPEFGLWFTILDKVDYPYVPPFAVHLDFFALSR